MQDDVAGKGLNEVFEEIIQDEKMGGTTDEEIEAFRDIFMCGACVAIKQMRDTPNVQSLAERLDQLEQEAGFEIVRILNRHSSGAREDGSEEA